MSVEKGDDEMSILEQLVATASLYNRAMLKDTAIAITDLNQYLYYEPGKKLNHRVAAGDPVKEGTLAARAMRMGQQQIAVMDSSLFGFPYIGVATPVFKTGTRTVIGCIFIGENTETQEMIKENTESITENMVGVNQMAHEISEKMSGLNALQKNLMDRLCRFEEEMKGIEGFSKTIEGIAKQTKMLGINATIESARLGQVGRGFAVVAEEIGKLAQNSQASASNIQNTTAEVQENSSKIIGEMEQIGVTTQEIGEILAKVAQAIEQATGMLEELNSMTQIG